MRVRRMKFPAGRIVSDSKSNPELTPLDSANARIRLAERLIEMTSQQLLDPGLSVSKRGELQRTVEDLRVELRRFRDQKGDLENP